MSSDHQGEHTDGIIEAGQKAPKYFYLLYFGLIIWGVIFMAYYLFSGWSSSQEFAEKMAAHTGIEATAAGESAETATNGAINATALFTDNCAGCHGADGKGGFGTDLSRNSYDYGKDAATVKASIRDGRGGKMPAFGGQLSAAEIDALVEYSITL